MKHYQQSLVLTANTATVYAAITSAAGLRGWWTQDCEIETRLGGKLEFRFGPHHKTMQIKTLKPGEEVRWRCVAAHIAVAHFKRSDEWVGTQLVFRLSPLDTHRTQLDFEHIGLEPSLDCYDLCSNGWQHCLGSLQQYVETGHGTPHAGVAQCAASATLQESSELRG